MQMYRESKVPIKTNFFLFERTFKMVRNGIYFIVIALLVAELFKILVYANKITCDVTFWTQSGVKSQKIEKLVEPKKHNIIFFLERRK